VAPTGGAGATPPPGTGRTTISDLLERLRTRGWRLTPQRRVVAKVLEGDHVHLSAETAHALATELLPEVSLATVYNTLNELVAMGEVDEVTVSGGPKRYDPNVTRHHQHLVCVQCGELRDVLPAGEESLGLPSDQAHGYRLVDVDIVFRGLCPRCRDGATPSADLRATSAPRA
jgi:Fe2+ or Zn2+ uptake regulation protein